MSRTRQVATIVAALLIASSTIALPTRPAVADPVPVAATTGARTGPDSLSVDRLYRAFFLREPDAAGLAYWRGLVSRGRPLSAVALEFARSAEFRTRYGSLDDRGFVDLVYRNVMGREADAGGRAHWTGVLTSGRLSRGGVMLSFSDSAEFKVRTGLVGSSVQTKVTASHPGRKELVLIDSSGRNRSRTAPTLAERHIYVHVRFPAGTDGLPRTDQAWPVHIVGSYRSGPIPMCSGGGAVSDRIQVCVGFPMMDHQSGINWADIPNHTQDVSAVLDALILDPGVAGRVNLDRIVYSGASMGGITGLAFANGPGNDPRIRAVVSWVGFALFAIPEIAQPTEWHPTAPATLMINAHDDPDITYELARRTFEHAPAGAVTFVTIRSGNGGHSPTCPSASEYSGRWIDHHLFGTPMPATSLLTGCAVMGLLPGGSKGFGLAAPSVR